tara:strand:+ start:142 stop:303 length:162 start_codon:yes stop_codon:yes gene_type:complete
MTRYLILLAAAAMMFSSLWLLDHKWGAEALDYQECGGRYCTELDPPSAPAYKR